MSNDNLNNLVIDIDRCLAQIRTPQGIIAKPVTEGLNRTNEQIFAAFDQGAPIQVLVRQKSEVIDHVLNFCFDSFVSVSVVS